MLEANLDDLRKGYPAISKNVGQYLAEGGAYCLESNGHSSGIVLNVEGDFKAPNTIEARVQLKRKQLEQSDGTQLPAFIMVVEFRTPKAKFVIK